VPLGGYPPSRVWGAEDTRVVQEDEETAESRGTGTAVDLVLIGAECPEERSLSATLGAAAGAELFGRAISGALLDAGSDRCRVLRAPPDADANALHTAVRDASRPSGRLLVVYLAGQLVEDPRRRRPVLAVTGSRREDAHRHGLPCDWVLSAMAHGGHAESLLVLDVVVDRAEWDSWQTREESGASGPLGLPTEAGVPLWGRALRCGVPRLRRNGASAAAGSFARALASVLAQGVPGHPAALDPAALHAALDPALDPGAANVPVRSLPPPATSRLLLRNRAALRGSLTPDELPGALRDVSG
jgi:hypothetical protein